MAAYRASELNTNARLPSSMSPRKGLVERARSARDVVALPGTVDADFEFPKLADGFDLKGYEDAIGVH
jgi:hypothetical protein